MERTQAQVLAVTAQRARLLAPKTLPTAGPLPPHPSL